MNRLRYLLSLALWVVLGCFSGKAEAQITVTTGLTPLQYVQAFAGTGTGATIGPITFTGDPDQIGLFNIANGTPGIGLTSGLILSSGAADGGAFAPIGSPPSSFASTGYGGPGFPLLNAIAGAQTHDAVTLTFEFTPIGDTAKFKFVFGSEEYPEFAPPSSSSFNDAFGFFVNGPGFAPNTNIALLPGTSTIVSINNVNAVTNTAYYVSNTLTNFIYDAYTVVIEAVAVVVPCSTYTLTLAIADGGDGILDSGVLVEAFTISGVTSTPIGNVDATGNTFIYEGCSDAGFQIVRDPALSDTLPLVVIGNAVQGLDIAPLPDTVFFLPGQDTLFLPLAALWDGVVEPTDTVSILVPSLNPCAPTGFDTATILIQNIHPLLPNPALPDTIVICEDDIVFLDPVMLGGIPNTTETYYWIINGDTVSNDSAFSDSFAVDAKIHIHVYENGSCSTPPYIDSIQVMVGTLFAPLVLNETPDTIVCTGDTVTLFGNAAGGSGVYIYTWSLNGATIGTGSSVTITPTSPGLVTYRVSVFDTCTTTIDSVIVLIEPRPSTAFNLPTAACVGDVVTATFQGAPANGFLYTWNFTGGGVPSAAFGATNQSASWAFPGLKQVVLNSFTSVCSSTTVQDINITIQPVVAAGPNFTICQNDSIQLQGSANTNVAGCNIVWTAIGGAAPASGTLNPVVAPLSTTDYILNVACGSCVASPDTVRVIVRPSPTVSITTTSPSMCLGDTGVAISGIAAGGFGAITYEWVPPTFVADPLSNSTIAAPTATTVYGLVATDAMGCRSLPGFVTVNIHNPPMPDAGPDQTICFGSTAQLAGIATGGSGFYNYSWSPSTGLQGPANQQTVDASPPSSTTYALSVIDAVTGCVSAISAPEAYVTLHLVNQAAADAGPATVEICAGDTVFVGNPISGSNPAYTYQWTPAEGLADTASGYTAAFPSSTTTYTLNVAEGACAGVPDQIIVIVRQLPTVDVPTGIGPICPGATFTPNALVTGGVGALNFIWAPAPAFINATLLNPTGSADSSMGLMLTVTDASGCSVSDSGSVYVTPTPILDADRLSNPNEIRYCRNSQTIGVNLNPGFGAAIDSLFWQAPLGTNQVNPLVDPATTTDYVLEGAYGTGCIVLDTVRVFVLPSIEALIVPEADTLCTGMPILLVGHGGVGAATFNWEPSVFFSCDSCHTTLFSPSITASADTLTVHLSVSESGCSDDTSYMFTIMESPTADFTFGDQPLCLPEAFVQFMNQSQNAIRFDWAFGDGSIDSALHPGKLYDSIGTYNVTLIAYADTSSYCSDTLTHPVDIQVFDSVKASISSSLMPADTLWLPVGSVQFTDSSSGSGISWNWEFGDGQTAITQNPEHEYQVAGAFTVTLAVMNAGGCADTATFGPIVVANQNVVLPPNVFTPNGDGQNDVIGFGYDGSESYAFFVLDRWGNRVFATTTPNQKWNGTHNNGQECPAGTYFYNAEIGSRQFTGSITLIR